MTSDYAIWGNAYFTWTASTEGQDQREHREDQSQQNVTLSCLKCHWGKLHFSCCVFFRLKILLLQDTAYVILEIVYVFALVVDLSGYLAFGFSQW